MDINIINITFTYSKIQWHIRATAGTKNKQTKKRGARGEKKRIHSLIYDLRL